MFSPKKRSTYNLCVHKLKQNATNFHMGRVILIFLPSVHSVLRLYLHSTRENPHPLPAAQHSLHHVTTGCLNIDKNIDKNKFLKRI